MTIRALYPWSAQWVPVQLRRDCLWWHDGPVGRSAPIEIEYAGQESGELVLAAHTQRELLGMGYRNVKLRAREEVET